MAGPIQVGDIIKFTETAWRLWEYGWAPEYNASENYRSFGLDVRSLHGSLQALEDAVIQAQSSLLNHGARSRDILGGDKGSLSEIIGDYEATLEDCKQLLEDNKRYAQATGAVRNIDWNINIMPQVDRLRDRIHMHTIRIQHVLKPFEIDLITKFHGDLVQRITGLHTDVLIIKRDISALLNEKYPELAEARRAERAVYSVRIPDALVGRLQGMLERCNSDGSDRSLTLQEMTDCFLIHFSRSTVQLQPVLDGSKTYPPLTHYVELLKCQLLMHRIKSVNELQNPLRMSHWPGYITALEERLSQECARFQTELIAPDTPNCGDELLAFWPEDEPKKKQPQSITGSSYNCLLEVPLATDTDLMAWRSMKLLRATVSDQRFRIIETWGGSDQSQPEETRVVDFNTNAAVLIPIYADPIDERGSPPPLEIVLEENHASHQYVFVDIKHVLLFQQAVTGFKVASNYMESRAVAVSVRPGQNQSVTEDVTLQLWLPSRLKEQPDTSRGDSGRNAGLASQDLVTSNSSHSRRPSSIFSSQSVTAPSFMSYSSSGSEDIIGIRLDRRHASTEYGVMRPRPRNPLLVFFTKCRKTSRRSIVAIKIDDETKPNPERCNCQIYEDCRITALEQGRGPALLAKRLENHAKWDLLSLSSAPSWSGLLRVSILFPTVEARRRFGGLYCGCKLETHDDVDACLSAEHQGLLGIIRVGYWRQMLLWQEQRDGRRQVDARWGSPPVGR